MFTKNDTITSVPGITVGHAQDQTALTDCTVIICEKGAIGGVDQRGGAPGTRETDALRPMPLVKNVHAVVLAGGSAFGPDASNGVMKYLKEKNIGFNTGVDRVPIVASAVLFDLGLGNAEIYPDTLMGYSACMSASSSPVDQGNYGAGMGASVGEVLGLKNAMKSGIGSSVLYIGGGIVVGAIMAVNAFGDIVSPESGKNIAGARPTSIGPLNIGGTGSFANSMSILKTILGRSILRLASFQNTIIGVVAINAKLSKEETNKVAQMAQDGIARVVRRAHTMLDGDTIFALATCQRKSNVNIVGVFVAEVVSRATLNALIFSQPAGGLPAFSGGFSNKL